MASIDVIALERRIRRRYEAARLGRAVLGMLPAAALVWLAVVIAARPSSTLLFGIAMLLGGVALLWYGREPRRALLPGLGAGIVPLGLALAANAWGHVCTGSGCTTLCLPACVAGGTIAGLLVASVGHRRRAGWGFWGTASAIALLTGAMGCACIGLAGVGGLVLGFGAGLLPDLGRTFRDRAGSA